MSIGYHKKGYNIKITVTRGKEYTSEQIGSWEGMVTSNVFYSGGTVNLYYEKPLYIIPDIPYPAVGDTTQYYYHYFVNGVYNRTAYMYGYRNTSTGEWAIYFSDPFKGSGTSVPDNKLHLILIEKSDGYYLTAPSFYLIESGTGYHYYAYDGDIGRIITQTTQEIYGFPYGDGESTSQGGQGEMSDTSEPIEIDSKPLLTSGEFLRVYKTNATGLTALKEKLISNGFLDGLIPKLRTDATDYLLGLNAIPLASTDVASDTIKIANLDTEIASEYLTWYIADLDCGEIDIKEYFQTFMDYSPYTKMSIYLPYCATIPLNIDMFQNDKIKLKYRVDFLTGYCLAIISNSEGVVTTATGNCAYNLPIRSNDYNNVVSRGLAVVGGIVGTAGALATGNVPLAVGTAGATLAGGLSLGNAMEKPNVYSNGTLGGNYGLLGNRTPYLIIQRPTISVPSDYGKTIGYMSRITAKLGDLTGYTVVEEIHLEHISATDDEKRMIESALKSGVIL